MKKRNLYQLVGVVILFICIVTFTITQTAHADVDWSAVFTDTGWDYRQWNQYDGSGWINLTVDNQSNKTWGDFHFFIFDIGNGTTDIKFVGSGANQPQSSQSPLTWSLSNNDQTIDLFYYSDPVAPTESGTFKVHVENPNQTMHGVAFYPTVVPEPISTILFITGGTLLAGRRFFGRKTRQ